MCVSITADMAEPTDRFLEETEYVDWKDMLITRETSQTIIGCKTDEDKVKAVFEFVRDGITNAMNIDSVALPWTASTTVRAMVGTDDSKAMVFAAMVRALGIPAGFCYQRLTVVDDDSEGYYLHCYNAVYLDGKWIKVDASGRLGARDATFCKIEPDLAFIPREVYGESNISGIFARPYEKSMDVLKSAERISDIIFGLPDTIDIEPDVKE